VGNRNSGTPRLGREPLQAKAAKRFLTLPAFTIEARKPGSQARRGYPGITMSTMMGRWSEPMFLPLLRVITRISELTKQ
jgi:hypothetical protein